MELVFPIVQQVLESFLLKQARFVQREFRHNHAPKHCVDQLCLSREFRDGNFENLQKHFLQLPR